MTLSASMHLLQRLASLRFTLCLLIALAIGTFIAYRIEGMRTWPMVIPLMLLAINLVAAVVTNGVFRRQLSLLIFHLSLVALLLLVAAGRLTYLNGFTGVTDGTEFDGTLAESDSGPWHSGELRSVRFMSKGFSIAYAPGLQRGETRNEISWMDRAGNWNDIVIGDQTALVLAGYRFYTTFNKGFAPTFEWRATAGSLHYGSVQLPPYPLKEYSQAAAWSPPGGMTSLWIMLDIDEVVLPTDDHTTFRLPSNYRLIVRTDTGRHELKAGDTLQLPDGELRFMGLRAWMGYRVFYDWTLPWLFASCAVGIASLAWHFWRKFTARPWDAQ